MSDTIDLWLKKYQPLALFGILVLAIALVAIRVNLRFWELDTKGSDTYYSWVEGQRILDGQNPYERVLHGDMKENSKYATYFPLFYEMSAFVQFMGIKQYRAWIDFWRYFFLAGNIAIGLTIWVIIFSKQRWALALLALLFWYFNRWTLHSSASAVLDFIPISLMVLSLGLNNKYQKTSLLLFSFSLAIKQIGIFLAPLYLIWEFQRSRSLKKTIIAGLWIVCIPLLSSLPFLLWNAEGVFKSLAFSATRDAINHFDAESIDVIFNLNGLLARIPFLIMLCGAYFTSWQRIVGRYGSAMLVMGIFIAFK